MRVLAALSGGVDSAVAAARAVDAGHEVVGVHMALSRSRPEQRSGSRGCCSVEDASDARRAADVLGIPYYVWDLSEQFEDTVVADFLAEYAAGRTPNPCVRCNEHVKFAALLDRALALGFDAVCTGHYARVVARGPASAAGEVDGSTSAATSGATGGSAAAEVDGATPARELHRAADLAKDQSYVLAVMGPGRLAHALFPLGDVPSKDAVRAEAAARGLAVSAKPDSFDVCFVADGDTRGFLRERLGAAPGPVVDVDGTVLGVHDGAYAFTVGQRRGLRLGRPAPDGRPRYVLSVSPARSTVVVGPEEALAVRRLVGTDLVWFAPDVPARDWTAAEVQVRAHGAALPAQVRRVGGGAAAGRPAQEPAGPDGLGGVVATPAAADLLEVRLDRSVRRVAPGQSVVVYGGSRVLGQATVDRAEPVAARAEGRKR